MISDVKVVIHTLSEIPPDRHNIFMRKKESERCDSGLREGISTSEVTVDNVHLVWGFEGLNVPIWGIAVFT